MNGNNNTQIVHARNVVEEWCKTLRIGHLTRFDAWTTLNNIVMKEL